MYKVSVVIPLFNQGDYILDTLESVYNQTYEKIEIIVVNDGSTEKSTLEQISKIKKMRKLLFLIR
ncbi:glycosyltransferase family 2 protein [Photobacterium leiognathi]|uniref:glycosyltransferase family 2 protein n=1 Tax=Photobacterium leiognathi TaxID=553611 RepID=UPI0027330F5E|nr:glycosyltransferase [Photobacterium leiognathi]